jgi:hypothetical protein
MAISPRISKEALSISVVVRRRSRAGGAPFGWEVHGADTAEPIHVSPDRFISMEEAYGAGKARLSEFIPKRSSFSEASENHLWQLREMGTGAVEEQLHHSGD